MSGWKQHQVVAFFPEHHGNVTPRKRVIKRVTPSGIAVVELVSGVGNIYTRQFNKDGWERGGIGFSRARIVPWTEEHDRVRVEARAKALASHVANFMHVVRDYKPEEIKAEVDKQLAERLDYKKLS